MSTHNMFSEIRKGLIFGQVNLGWKVDFDHLLVLGQVLNLTIPQPCFSSSYTLVKQT